MMFRTDITKRSTLFLLFIFLFSFCLEAQRNTPINIEAGNVTLAALLDSISAQSGYRFAYNPDKIRTDTIISVAIHNERIPKALDFLADLGITGKAKILGVCHKWLYP
jgi:hypothetical protein